MEAISADVSIDRGASDEEVQAVELAFRDAGVQASVTTGFGTKSLTASPWMVWTAIPVGLFLKSFLSEAGRDAWKGLKTFVQNVHAARARSKQPPGVIILQDTDTRIQIVLPVSLPDEAYEKLLVLEVKSFQRGPVHYHADPGEWLSVWKEPGDHR